MPAGPAQAQSLKQEPELADKFIPLAPQFMVAPQLTADDIRAAAANGVTLIVNNRPDGEIIGQPKSAELEAAAKDAGVAYVHLPVDVRGITPDHTAGLEQAMNDAPEGKTLAFCRSGTRSTLVWSYAEARFGKPVAQIIEEAAAAGYDISGHEPALTLLFEAHKAPRTEPPL
ncbi:MAG: TIGR01244 family sulfur transferase [Pseudomonadota bacterium]